MMNDVPSGGQLDQRRDRDRAVAARLVLDHHPLADLLLQPAPHDARHGVGQPARPRRDDELDRLRRIRGLAQRRRLVASAPTAVAPSPISTVRRC